MSKRRSKKQVEREMKKRAMRTAIRSGASYRKGSGKSKYARKKAYCRKHGVWGWEVPEPKPWKGQE